MAKNPKQFTVRAQYNFADDGAIGAWVVLANNLVIPDNAIITKIMFHVVNAVTTSTGTPILTFAIGPIGGTPDRFIITSGQAYTNYSQDAILNGFTSKSKSAENLSIVWGSFSGVTGGIIDIYISYYLGYAE